MSSKPEKKDFQTAYQVAGQTVYARRSDKNKGAYIQILKPEDASNMHRSFVAQAAKDFDPAKQEGIWTELKAREFEAEQQRRSEMERQYIGAYRAWEKEQEQENHIAYMQAVRTNHYPHDSQYDSRAEYAQAVKEYEAEIIRTLPKFLNNDIRFQYVFTIAMGAYLGKLLAGYKMFHDGNEIVPMGINHETGLMKCLLLEESGIPKNMIELAFETPVRLETSKRRWTYTWNEYGGFGGRPSYMALEIEIRWESPETVRTLNGGIYFYQDGATLSWPSSHYTLEESREILKIHNYLLSLAELWESQRISTAQ